MMKHLWAQDLRQLFWVVCVPFDRHLQYTSSAAPALCTSVLLISKPPKQNPGEVE